MRILLVGINARFVHTNLAIRYLRSALEDSGKERFEVLVREFSINDSLEKMSGEIFEEKPDVIGFSCYIWNISQIKLLIRRLKLILPRVRFCLGGPEVSFDPIEISAVNREVDAIIVGEGEESFPNLIKAWADGNLPWGVQGVIWRLSQRNTPMGKLREEISPPGFMGTLIPDQEEYIISNEMCTQMIPLDTLPNPYCIDEDFLGKLVYVETSRGCPFNCRFCISSTFRGVRFLNPERFRIVLQQLFSGGARTIKFVDRTFNANKKHAFAILDVFKEEALRVIQAEPGRTQKQQIPRAHCEMAGELLDQEWLNYLKNYPKNMIQLEIGVQSTHQLTLEAVNRPQHFSGWRQKIIEIQHTFGIPVHLDLIAGLPYEGWKEFKKSFDEVYDVRPNHLQLGFLKVLKGSGIWERSSAYGLIYSPDPPYTILQTHCLGHEQILALGRLEEILELYGNSDRFKFTLELLLKVYRSPFDFFYGFSEFWHEKGWFKREWSVKSLFHNLWEFICSVFSDNPIKIDSKEDGIDRIEVFREALRFDYYLYTRPGEVPEFLHSDIDHRSKEDQRQQLYVREQIRNEESWREKIPEIEGMDKRQWSRVTAVEYFSWGIPSSLKAERLHESGVWVLFYYGGEETRFFKVEGLDFFTGQEDKI